MAYVDPDEAFNLTDVMVSRSIAHSLIRIANVLEGHEGDKIHTLTDQVGRIVQRMDEK